MLDRIVTALRGEPVAQEGAPAGADGKSMLQWSAEWREARAMGEVPPETTLEQYVAMKTGRG